MKSKKKKPQTQKSSVNESAEAPTTEVLTIGWLLTVMTTLVCEVAYFIAMLILRRQADLQWLALLAGVLMFAALVVGLTSVGLLVLVHRLRKSQPPTPIVACSLFIGLTPVLVAIARAFSS